MNSLVNNRLFPIDTSYKIPFRNLYKISVRKVEEAHKSVQTFEIDQDAKIPLEIVFAIDISSSMKAQLNIVKENTLALWENLNENRYSLKVGLVFFVDDVERVSPLTSDMMFLVGELKKQKLSVSFDNRDGSEGGLKAISQSISMLNASEDSPKNTHKIVFYVSDNFAHDSSGESYSRNCEVDFAAAGFNEIEEKSSKNFRFFYSVALKLTTYWSRKKTPLLTTILDARFLKHQ